MATAHLTSKQCSKIKSLIMDINNHLNEVYPSSDSLNKDISPGFRLIIIFSNHFSFISVNWKNSEALIAY